MFLFLASSAISILPLNSATKSPERSVAEHTFATASAPAMTGNNTISFRDQSGRGSIPASSFKTLEFCTAEASGYSILSATVYFYGKGFHAVAKGMLTGSSLQPIEGLMKQCKAGSVVTFDEIKILGPDKQIQNVEDVSYLLY